jgi:hypothetical protein
MTISAELALKEKEEDIALLLAVVRARFLSQDSDRAIITAIEGLKWLAGDGSVVSRDWLREFLESKG